MFLFLLYGKLLGIIGGVVMAHGAIAIKRDDLKKIGTIYYGQESYALSLMRQKVDFIFGIFLLISSFLINLIDFFCVEKVMIDLENINPSEVLVYVIITGVMFFAFFYIKNKEVKKLEIMIGEQ